MGNRAAKFVSTLVAGVIAGAPLPAVSQTAPAPTNAPAATSAANAAADCLASPKGVAPQGQHWYYRLDRATKRQCWYLRAAGDKNSPKATQTAQVENDMPAAETSPPQQQNPVQDARAEYLGPRGGAAAKAPSAVAQAAAAPTSQPAADQAAESLTQQPASPQSSSPWPDVPAASAQPAPAAVTAAAQPAKPSKSPSPVALAAAENIPTDKPGGSLQMLLLVIGGALTLAGILASLIYRFAGARVRVQAADRQGYWDDWETHQEDASRAPWRDMEPSDRPPPRPIDFDAARPQPAKQLTKLAAISREIHLIDARKSRAAAAAAEPEKTTRDEDAVRMFEGAFEIVAAAAELAANESAKDRVIKDRAIKGRAIKGRTDAGDRPDAPADRDADAVNVDVITTMLEQLAMEGPRLTRPKPEAEPANSERSRRGRSAARA
jgi:hypothetical protein